MVSLIEANGILCKSVLNVLDDMVRLTTLEEVKSTDKVRLEETSISISEVRDRLDDVVVVGHNLVQYVNKFYDIYLDTEDVVALDYLMHVNREQIDLTEFGEFI